MDSTVYESMDGFALAEHLRCGDVSVRDLMEVAVRLARVRGAALNALCYEQYDESLELASGWSQRGVFAGLPFLLKDSGLPSRRFPSSIGSRLFNNTTYAENATLVDRFDQAGFLPFARSTSPELCMSPTTEAARNGGATRNPVDLSRSPGGSSGGAAAAVAAGIVPVAHGSDGGGSIRIPAACCGIYGLKPSRGRVPMGPLRGEGWGGLACDGVLSRSVRDTAATMDAIGGFQAGNPYAAPDAPESFLGSLAQPFDRPLRIGVWREPWNNIPVDSQCLDALSHTAALCRQLGHQLVELAPPRLDYEAFVQAHIDVMGANIAVSVDSRLKLSGKNLDVDDLEPAILDGYAMGKAVTAARYIQAINNFHLVGRVMANYMRDVDLVLTPTLTSLPAMLGELEHKGSFVEFRTKVSRYATFLAVINASGQPAASLPLYWTPEKLPVATQIIGHFGDEDTILRLSAQLEMIENWTPKLAEAVAGQPFQK